MQQNRTGLEKTYIYLFRSLLVLNILWLFVYLSFVFISASYPLYGIGSVMRTVREILSLIEPIFILAVPLALLLSFALIIVAFLYKSSLKQKESTNRLIKAPVLKAWGMLVLTILLAFVVWGSISLVYRPSIEYHAAAEIYERPDVKTVIDKYPSHIAWVSPLNYAYIEDKDFVKKLLPDYAHVNVHCILVAHSPDGTRYFLEDGDTADVFIEIPSDEFNEMLMNASPEDVETFWKNVRPDVRLVQEHYTHSLE